MQGVRDEYYLPVCFLNFHEEKPGEFDFTGKRTWLSSAACARRMICMLSSVPVRMYVPSGKWAGLPWWLLKKKDIRLREDDPYFLERVAIFEKEVANQVAGLTHTKGRSYYYGTGRE